MARAHLLVLTLVVAAAPAVVAPQQPLRGPETVTVQSGTLTLRALLWRPNGRGPFPAVVFNHGSGPASNPREPATLGPVFARHGYVFLFLFRRGAGLSADQGSNSAELMSRELAAKGLDARNHLQMRLLETELNDVLAGMAFVRARSDVDPRRVALVGHSFGGSLTLLAAEHDTAVRAAVVFGGAAGSWDRSPVLQQRLVAAVGHASAPVFFAYAANDFSVAPARVLGAEMARLGKPHRVEIYPSLGHTPEEGHALVYRGLSTWERDVFAFLDELMRK
jgi:carboxymethylenebutenolidase